jgi:hypothetical protein
MKNLSESRINHDLTQSQRELINLKETCYRYAVEYFREYRKEQTIDVSDIFKKAEEIRKYIMKPVLVKKDR